MTYFQRYPLGFWFLAATGEITDNMDIWADGHGSFWLYDRLVIKAEPWELITEKKDGSTITYSRKTV